MQKNKANARRNLSMGANQLRPFKPTGQTDRDNFNFTDKEDETSDMAKITVGNLEEEEKSATHNDVEEYEDDMNLNLKNINPRVPEAKAQGGGQKIIDFVKGYDYYANPITLTFNKKGSFSTLPGGLCSLFTTFLILLYFMLKIYMLATEATLLKTDSIFFNTIDQTNANITQPHFSGFGESISYSDSLTISSDNVTIGYKLSSTNPLLDPMIDKYVRG
jgi:hypothetical protein